MWKYFIAVSNQSLELTLTPALLLLLRTVFAHLTRERTTLLLLLLVKLTLFLSLCLCVCCTTCYAALQHHRYSQSGAFQVQLR
jgi:O-antigen ligase